MQLRLSDPRLADEFIAFLQRADWIVGLGEVEAHGEGIAIEVDVPNADDGAQARLELALYLRGWDAVYPGSAELLD